MRLSGLLRVPRDDVVTLFVDEVQQPGRGPSVGERTMVVFELDTVDRAQLSEPVRFVPGISTPHPHASAQLRKAKAPFKPFVLTRQEAVIEVHVVGDEDPVAHECHEAVGDFVEQGRIPNHLVVVRLGPSRIAKAARW